jgi:hypothetical protein
MRERPLPQAKKDFPLIRNNDRTLHSAFKEQSNRDSVARN